MLVLPVYKPKLKREPPVVTEVKCWSAERESGLQDCFDITDWSVFKDYATDLDEYADSCVRLC